MPPLAPPAGRGPLALSRPGDAGMPAAWSERPADGPRPDPHPAVPVTTVKHLYLHVPFCRHHCPYCDYAVVTGARADVSRWAAALGLELRMREATGVSLAHLETLLVGGGTPSFLGAGLADGVRALLSVERVSRLSEWTVEVNPEDVSAAMLAGWRAAGVNRINIGIQSLRARALEWLGRRHSPSQAFGAMGRVGRAGMDSWGIDLLFGLPPEIDPDPTVSLRRAIDAQVPHVSLYELVVEPGTPLEARVRHGSCELADADLCADQYLALHATLAAAGYEAYEMTSFALPEHRSRHTCAILREEPWLGLGPGAHSNYGGQRLRNLKDWRGYLGAVAQRLPPAAEAVITDRNSPEALWFRLRRAEGIRRAELRSSSCRLADGWVERKLAFEDRSRIRLTPAGWLRLDELSGELARAEAEAPPTA